MLFCHGCVHRATDFYDAGPGCPKCIGLPVERTLVAAALARGFVTVAVSSEGTSPPPLPTVAPTRVPTVQSLPPSLSGAGRSFCWAPDRDLPRVRAALSHVRAARGLPPALPLVVLGASSGKP